MRRTLAAICLLFLATPALADPPAPYEYITSYKLGKGFKLCDAIFGQLISTRNELYLRYHPGAPVNDPGKGEGMGMFFYMPDAAVSQPVWHWNNDNGNGDTLLDLDGDNRKEKILSTPGAAGEFPRLSMTDGSELAAALANTKGSYIINFEYRPYVVAREFGRLKVYQLWKTNAPLETRVCEFVTTDPVEGKDVVMQNVAIPLEARNFH